MKIKSIINLEGVGEWGLTFWVVLAKVIVVVNDDEKKRKLSQMFTYKMSIPSPFWIENAFMKEKKAKEKKIYVQDAEYSIPLKVFSYSDHSETSNI